MPTMKYGLKSLVSYLWISSIRKNLLCTFVLDIKGVTYQAILCYIYTLTVEAHRKEVISQLVIRILDNLPIELTN